MRGIVKSGPRRCPHLTLEICVPLGGEGLCDARIGYGLLDIGGGPRQSVRSSNRKFVTPPRSEIGVSMEALIHHFKLWTEGFPAPKASIYSAVESPRGELGLLLEGDGGPKPLRVHLRTPSFDNLAVLSQIVKGYLVADLVAILSSIDIVLGDIDR